MFLFFNVSKLNQNLQKMLEDTGLAEAMGDKSKPVDEKTIQTFCDPQNPFFKICSSFFTSTTGMNQGYIDKVKMF